MNHVRIRTAAVRAVAISGAVLNALYCADLLGVFLSPHYESAVREMVISAIVLEFAWALLLGWVALKPLERRHILLFTIVPILLGNVLHKPILLGNVLHNMNSLVSTRWSPGAVALNMSIGVLYAGLYVAAYVAARPAAQSQIQTITRGKGVSNG